MAMAAGEYVSVSSQADTEAADSARERKELAIAPKAELEELAQIYVARGLDSELARKVASQLMVSDAFGAHARDELGLSDHVEARPVQAALTSAATFTAGAALPLALAAVTPIGWLTYVVFAGALAGLAVLGAVGAKVGGASVLKPALRVTFWGAFAMVATAAIGALIGHPL